MRLVMAPQALMPPPLIAGTHVEYAAPLLPTARGWGPWVLRVPSVSPETWQCLWEGWDVKAAPNARGSRGSATAWLWNGLFLHLLITEEVKPDPGKQARSAEINSPQQDKGTDLCAAQATAFPQAQQQLPRSSSETCTIRVAAPAPPAASLCDSQGTAVSQICLRYQPDLLQISSRSAGDTSCPGRGSTGNSHSPFGSAATCTAWTESTCTLHNQREIHSQHNIPGSNRTQPSLFSRRQSSAKQVLTCIPHLTFLYLHLLCKLALVFIPKCSGVSHALVQFRAGFSRGLCATWHSGAHSEAEPLLLHRHTWHLPVSPCLAPHTPVPLPALPWDSKSWKRQRCLMGFAEAASSVTASCLLSQACFLNLYLCIIKH